MCKIRKKSFCIILTYFFFIHSIIGFETIVQMLIEKGANVNAVNEDNNSALIYAALEGKIFLHMNIYHCNKYI